MTISSDFFFKDTHVLIARGKREKANKRKGIRGDDGPTVPYPDSLAQSENHEIKTAWGLWYILALMIRKKAGLSKNYYKCVSHFSCENGVFTIFITPRVAKMLNVPVVQQFVSSNHTTHTATTVYVEAAIKINGL